MARTLRQPCARCGTLLFVAEGAPRTHCSECGLEGPVVDRRGVPLADVVCPHCWTVAEVELDATLLACRACGTTHLTLAGRAPRRYLVRERVMQPRALALAATLDARPPVRTLLAWVPVWRYRGTRVTWALAAERASEQGEAPAPAGAPAPVRVPSAKRTEPREVREELLDPAAEGFLWRPAGRAVEESTLVALSAAEVGADGVVVRPLLDGPRATELCRRRGASSVESGASPASSATERSDVLCETLALVYHPYWVVTYDDPTPPTASVALVDAWTAHVSRRAARELPFLTDPSRCEAAPPAPVLLPLVCLRCGRAFDRQPARSFGAVCPACGSFFELGAAGAVPRPARFVRAAFAPSHTAAPVVYLPVWRHAAQLLEEGGARIRTRRDWKRHLPSHAAQPERTDSEQPLRFYAVAALPWDHVRLDPLSIALTRVQPDLAYETPSRPVALPATREAETAERLAYSLWLSLVRDHVGRGGARPAPVTIEQAGAELLYVPCERSRDELRDLVLGVHLRLPTPAAA